MAFTTADATTLRDAIAQGALEIEYADGRRVRYFSLADMLEALRVIEAEFARAEDGPRIYGGYARKGF